MGAPVLRVAEAQQARIMLNFLLAHKIAIGRMLSVVGATATVVIFEYFFELAVYIAVPVAVLAYVTMPMVWAELIDSASAAIPSLMPGYARAAFHSSLPLCLTAGGAKTPCAAVLRQVVFGRRLRLKASNWRNSRLIWRKDAPNGEIVSKPPRLV